MLWREGPERVRRTVRGCRNRGGQPGSRDTVGTVDRLLGDCSLDVLRRRHSWKWTQYPPDVLPAWVAEMDFDLAEPVKDAVRDAVTAGDCGYPHPLGLGEAYAGFARERFGWAPDPGRVYAVPDVMTGIAEVLQEVTPHGSGVVINPPVYPPFFFRLRLAGREVVEAPLRRDGDGRYHLDPGRGGRRPGPGTAWRAYLLCSPHNPTGRVWSRAGPDRGRGGLRHGAAWRSSVDEIHAPLDVARRRAHPVPVAGSRPQRGRAHLHLHVRFQGAGTSRA